MLEESVITVPTIEEAPMPPFRLYDSSLLPAGFRYPAKFASFSDGVYPNVAPWWFVDAQSDAGKLFWRIRMHDGRDLVPFAKVDDGRGDVACFDGLDATGNSRVFMLVLDDGGREYSFPDFDGWLEAALADAAKWSAEPER